MMNQGGRSAGSGFYDFAADDWPGGESAGAEGIIACAQKTPPSPMIRLARNSKARHLLELQSRTGIRFAQRVSPNVGVLKRREAERT
jgi:hypothetical protein